MLKRTPLFAAHQKLGAKLVEFGGWEMPLQYSSIVDEHLAVRKAAGLFDISHMGEIRISGGGALEFLNRLLTNDLRKLAVGQGQYTLMCHERGGVIDDLYAYRTGENEFLLIVNASRIEPDFAWIKTQLATWPEPSPLLGGVRGGFSASVQLENASERFGAVALQGPRTPQFIDTCFPQPTGQGTPVARVGGLKKNQFVEAQFQDAYVYVARTGYTGEDGFEVIAPSEVIEPIWNHILSIGHAYCLQPAGLGARDTLRTEVCYPLYGHELTEEITPIEAGLSVFVALDKPEFIGRVVLVEQRQNGVSRKSVAFKMADKTPPPRPHYSIHAPGQGEKIGEVTSGTQSPSLGIGIGIGYVTPSFAQPGTTLEIEIRGRRFPATVVPKPIYRKD